MNTDGSPVYKSTKNSLWPIQFRINEFPPEKRFLSENLMLAGLWFGKKEPNMQVFMKPFVQEMYDLYHNGFSWQHHEEVIETKVITLNCVVDSVAKPTLQGTTQFNGYFGCNYCYHPGDLIDNQISVAKLTVTLWTDSKSHNSPYYIGKKVDTIDERLLNIKPLNQLQEGLDP
ncbi:hypothetical protein JTE90_003371 [Oedothorax gibbosus]|uniref:Uncharacterized protein n=1 Tax=Oedothorax gibbosus TaxID=931172 RepID=A0AAV6TXN2_9ARAC|nr:hypothetical protein JTE90_003371 [Oedothorax gibbosus]